MRLVSHERVVEASSSVGRRLQPDSYGSSRMNGLLA